MRKSAIGILLMVFGLATLQAQDKKVPEKLTFTVKLGNVAFDHATHVKRENGNCKVCHPGLFAEDSKAPLAFKPPHSKEEDQKASCGSCHRTGGTAFATKANCANGKCHIKTASNKGE